MRAGSVPRSCSPGSVTPAASRRGAPACSISATGGLTHFIDALLPAVASQARCANFEPAGRASHHARQRAISSGRESAASSAVIAAQASSASSGQPCAATNSRASANGKSNAASQGPGSRSQPSQASNDSKATSRSRTMRGAACPPSPASGATLPIATVIGLRGRGALVKSTPASRVALVTPSAFGTAPRP